MKQISAEEILEMALPHLRSAGYVGESIEAEQKAWLVKVMAATREYISYAAQVVEHVDVFFNDNVELENDEAYEVLRDADAPAVFDAFKAKIDALEVVDPASIKALLKAITKELKLGGKKVFMPIRVALTGKMHGPELIDLIPLLGRERALGRLNATLEKV
jgi:nondiscriminating glutamyl-tRNA synthetase